MDFFLLFSFSSIPRRRLAYYYTYKVRRRRAWQMPYTEASQRHDNQRRVRQTMISSPIYDARKEAYQHRGNYQPTYYERAKKMNGIFCFFL